MSKIKRWWKRLMNSGYNEQIYDNYSDEINLQNRRMVLSSSFIGSVIMILLSIAALFVPSVSKVLPLYLTTAIIFILIHTITVFVGHKNSGVTLICNYAFLVGAFFFAIGLDIIQKNDTATTICVLLVALPLLIVDRPYREFLFFAVVSICFMYEAIYIKQSPKAAIDVLNAVSFLMVGTFLGYKHNQMMLRNMRGHRMLETERDRDALTELYNKGALENRACEVLSQENVTASMIVIDMDDFKYINDTYGHHAGDELLTKVGAVLKALFRDGDLISRFGGDEFVIFMPGTDNRELLEERANHILTGVSCIRILADESYRAQICIGIAIYPSDGSNYEELFKHADSAMYEVKKNGKNGFAFYKR